MIAPIHMNKEIIPVHHLPEGGPVGISVERIIARGSEVMNDVHRHDFHELFIFATGTGDHMIDLDHMQVRPPCVHLVAPGQVHRLYRSGDSSGMVVMFGQEALIGQPLAPEVLAQMRAGTSAALSITPTMLAELVLLVEQIEAEGARETGPLSGVLQGYLGILLIKVAHWWRESKPASPGSEAPTDVVDRFVAAVSTSFLEKRQVGMYASDLSISPGHLNELVKKRLGKSASDVLQERLLLEAKRLLLHADLSVKEVSHALLMEDPAYFNRMFKKATGMTPVEYRTHIREKYKH